MLLHLKYLQNYYLQYSQNVSEIHIPLRTLLVFGVFALNTKPQTKHCTYVC